MKKLYSYGSVLAKVLEAQKCREKDVLSCKLAHNKVMS